MSIMPEEIITPSASTIGTPAGIRVSVLLTVEEARLLRDIMDGVRDNEEYDMCYGSDRFANDLYMTLNEEEQWTA